jgi:hypothetical protein
MPKPQGAQSDGATAKKPYVKPVVRSERVFETMALSCGKVQGTQGSCQHNHKVS